MSKAKPLVDVGEQNEKIYQLMLALQGIIELTEDDGDQRTIQRDRVCALLRPVAEGLCQVYVALNGDGEEQ